jgi:hypothetical protein
MITIQIDEKKYNKIVDDVENSLDFTLYDDYQTFTVGFEELTDLIDNAIRKAKQ